MADPAQIIAYLKQYQGKHPIATLKAQLIKQGVPEGEIDAALQTMSGAPAAPPASLGPPPPGYQPPKAPPVVPKGIGFILVVDDETSITDLMTTKLSDAGYRAVSANDAAQCLIQAEGMKIALVISDIQMPGFGSGVDGLKKLRASAYLPKNLPVIFLTGMSPEEAKKIVPLEDPYVRLMHKPVDWKLLRFYIRDLTGIDHLDQPLDLPSVL